MLCAFGICLDIYYEKLQFQLFNLIVSLAFLRRKNSDGQQSTSIYMISKSYTNRQFQS